MPFIIRSKQLLAISGLMEERANGELSQYLFQRFPSIHNESTAKETLKLIKAARTIAAGYGVQREDNIATFLDLTVMYGTDFHLMDWTKAALQRKELDGSEKMELLRQRVEETGITL